jgi:hypothetical protein
VLALGACGHRGRDAGSGAPVATGARAGERADAGERMTGLLPPLDSYRSGPLVMGDGWIRRSYSRAAPVEVTIARRPVTPEEYEDWERQSQGYPAAAVGIRGASGFFTCAGDGGAAPCDLHVQTRDGLHVEVMGGGRATRADLEQLFGRLPLR